MKTALITGANKGIGYAITKLLGQQQVRVIVGARNIERGQRAVTSLTAAGISNVAFVQLDLSDPTSIASAIETIQAQFGDLDILINNAGIAGKPVANQDLTTTDLQETLQVNFLGTYQLTVGLLPLIKANQGQIVNITIPTDPNPIWNPLAYKTSKAAQNVMTTSLAVDLAQAKSPVSIYSVHPGPTTTDLNGNLTYPGFHTPDEVATKLLPYLQDGKQRLGDFIEIYPQIHG